LFKFTSDLEALKELALKRFSALFWNLVENDFILNWKLNIIDAKKKEANWCKLWSRKEEQNRSR